MKINECNNIHDQMDCIPMPSAPVILGLLTGARWLHMYRPRRFQWTWFGVNQTSGSWIRVTAKFGRDDRQTHGGRCFQWSSPLAECFALMCVVLVSNLIILLTSAHWWSGYACPPQTHAKQYPHNRYHTNEVNIDMHRTRDLHRLHHDDVIKW